jgi:hypothetical protein
MELGARALTLRAQCADRRRSEQRQQLWRTIGLDEDNEHIKPIARPRVALGVH